MKKMTGAPGVAGALDLLSQFMPNEEVRAFAVERLGNVDNDTLQCILHTLVHDLRYESRVHSSPLSRFLLKRALLDQRVCCDLYWALEVNSASAAFGVRAIEGEGFSWGEE